MALAHPRKGKVICSDLDVLPLQACDLVCSHAAEPEADGDFVPQAHVRAVLAASDQDAERFPFRKESGWNGGLDPPIDTWVRLRESGYDPLRGPGVDNVLVEAPPHEHSDG